jgi:hypothetical protein
MHSLAVKLNPVIHGCSSLFPASLRLCNVTVLRGGSAPSACATGQMIPVFGDYGKIK